MSSIEASEDFEETLEILSNAELMQRLTEAGAEFVAGAGHSLEEVRERLRKDDANS
jgi:hypothetical protein